jgi:diacylglycerol kinase (ATP)
MINFKISSFSSARLWPIEGSNAVSKRALVLINLHSKSGASDMDRATTRLQEAGISVISKAIGKGEEIGSLIHQNWREVDFVVIGGGDGTMNAAASALVETGLPLGILPTGTANDLARTLKIPFDIEEAAQIIAEDRTHWIDLGMVNGRYFFNIANIGLGVQVKKNLSHESKRLWGVLSYAAGLIKSLKTFRAFRAEIVCDGHVHRVASIQIAVGNGRHYGGGMTVSAQAQIDDGTCFLYSVKPSSVWEVLKSALAFRSGQFKPHHPVDLDQGRNIEIRTSRRMAVTADGELVTHTPAKFTVCKAAIKVFVPSAYLAQLSEAGSC